MPDYALPPREYASRGPLAAAPAQSAQMRCLQAGSRDRGMPRWTDG